MLSTDFLISFGFMALLFLRQVYILKQPNKINYAPLMIAIGLISTLIHFISQPQNLETIVLVRESLLPLLVSLILYVLMNIMHQTQRSEYAREQEKFVKVLASELGELKEFILDLERRMNTAQKEDKDARESIIEKFQKDLSALSVIQSNQMKFVDMFTELEGSLQDVKKGYKHFSEVQLPDLDDVVHKHIDILRVAEQDHYNKLSLLLDKGIKSREELFEEIDAIKQSVSSIKEVSHEIAAKITKETLSQLSDITKSFEQQIILLKSHAEGINTSLTEDDRLLETVRSQSELLLKQMSLMSQRMLELQEQRGSYEKMFGTVNKLLDDMEHIRSDYVKSQAQLSAISHELLETKDKKVHEMKQNLDELSENLSKKIDDSLEKLHEHYHIASKDITQSVQTLAKKAQLKGYMDNE